MGLACVEHQFTGTTTSITSYDSTKTCLGPLIQQQTGPLSTDKYAGPLPIVMGRPIETTGAVPGMDPHAITVDSDNYYVALADGAAAAATRRLVLYRYTKSTGNLSWLGFITLNYPFAGTQGTYTIQAFRMYRYAYSTGTVGATGTTVTGSGTAWKTANFATGGRIGFGSTDPNAITTWYEVDGTAAFATDTSMTLTSSVAATIPSGTAYVYEEWRFVTLVTNGTTATNGGLFLTKGTHPTLFAPGGTNIPAATTVDNIRANYWLADAATNTATVGRGLGILPQNSNTDHPILLLNGTTTAQIYKHNLRASLSLTSGKDTSNFVLKTGTPAVTGTISATNNSRVATLSHGPGNGVECFYFVTTNRVYRVKTSDVLSNSTTFLTDAMIEVAPGSGTTFAATNALACIEYSTNLDRFFVMTTGTSGLRSYCTKYNTNSDPFDLIFLVDDKQLNQSTSDSGVTNHPAISGLPMTIWVEDGIAFLCRATATTSLNQIYVVPVGADWNFAASTNNRLITPALSTAGASSLNRLHVAESDYLGSTVLGTPPEPYRAYVRTSGISDNSGSWTLVDATGDLSGLTAGTQIQVMFEFKTIGGYCIPARIYSVAVSYQTGSPAGNFQPSVGKSSLSSKQFAWRHAFAYGSTVPTLKVQLYDAVTGTLLLTDTTATQASGTFERTTDGTSWSSWTNADKSGNDTYIRYTPSTFADNIRVRALLSEA